MHTGPWRRYGLRAPVPKGCRGPHVTCTPPLEPGGHGDPSLPVADSFRGFRLPSPVKGGDADTAPPVAVLRTPLALRVAMHVALALPSGLTCADEGGRSACCAHGLSSPLWAGGEKLSEVDRDKIGCPGGRRGRLPASGSVPLTFALAVGRHLVVVFIVSSLRGPGVIGRDEIRRERGEFQEACSTGWIVPATTWHLFARDCTTQK